LARWGDDEKQNEFFRPAWYHRPGSSAGYHVEFVAEHGDEVWLGGGPWQPFASSGLYRFNLKTGAFYSFNAHDGFKTCRADHVFDGLWLKDQLWLATRQGLCVVIPRK